MQGKLITFEGTDGCGKSTQIRLLNEYLTAQGIPVVVSREPGGSRIGENIRGILLSNENDEMSDMCELFLYEAARAQHMKEIVFPALREGKTVILDRFIDSTVAYQGFGRNLGWERVEQLNRAAISGRYPDLTLLLRLSPELAFRRKGGADADDRIEQAGSEFFERVQEGFEAVAVKYSRRIVRVSVDGSKEETQRKIRSLVCRLWEGREWT